MTENTEDSPTYQMADYLMEVIAFVFDIIIDYGINEGWEVMQQYALKDVSCAFTASFEKNFRNLFRLGKTILRTIGLGEDARGWYNSGWKTLCYC